MNLPARPPVDVRHRVRVLRALGFVAWTRRAPAAVGAGTNGAAGSTADAAWVVVVAEHCSPRALDLLGRALNASGPALARAGRVVARAGGLVEVPVATAYLVFGQTQAEVLRRSLPVEVLRRARVVVVDELATILADANAKRRLWVALRDVRGKKLAVAPG